VGEYEGRVQSIQLRVTRIETLNGELVTVPNTPLTGDAIVRLYGRAEHRIVDRVAIDDDEELAEALHHVTGAAADLDEVRDDPALGADIEELGDDAVVVRVHYWVDRPRPGDVVDIRSSYVRAVKRRLEVADISISPAPEQEPKGRITVDAGE